MDQTSRWFARFTYASDLNLCCDSRCISRYTLPGHCGSLIWFGRVIHAIVGYWRQTPPRLDVVVPLPPQVLRVTRLPYYLSSLRFYRFAYVVKTFSSGCNHPGVSCWRGDRSICTVDVAHYLVY